MKKHYIEYGFVNLSNILDVFTIDILNNKVYHIIKAAVLVVDLSLTSKQKLGSFNRVRNVMPPMSGRQDVLCEHPLGRSGG